MTATPLAGTAILLSRHVDALELSYRAEQVPGLLPGSDDALGRQLETMQHASRAYHLQRSVTTTWDWNGASVVLLPGSQRGARYCLECDTWMAFVATPRACRPRITVQLRADYLVTSGAVAAFEEVTGWFEEHLIPLIQSRTDSDTDGWRISRLDLAADALDSNLEARSMSEFTTRARDRDDRVEFNDATKDPVAVAPETALTHRRGHTLTGFGFGTRGQPVYARLHDKDRQAAPDALIRDVWTSALGGDIPSESTVWRVEFELRSAFLRELADGDQQPASDPRRILADYLDAIWAYLVGRVLPPPA